jgi:hypothetical protein
MADKSNPVTPKLMPQPLGTTFPWLSCDMARLHPILEWHVDMIYFFFESIHMEHAVESCGARTYPWPQN